MPQRARLARLIDQFIPVIRDAFRAAIWDITDNAVISAMVRAIELGDPVRALHAAGYSDAAMRPLTAAIERAFETGGMVTGSSFPRPLTSPMGAAVFRFDLRNSRAEAWLREHSSQLITNIRAETTTSIRNILTTGMTDGRNPRSVALDIVGRIDRTVGHRVGGVVGMTDRQAGWVQSARNELTNLDSRYFTRTLRDRRFDATVRNAIATGERLPQATIDRLATRYADRVLQYRGETIARTEALQSLNHAQREAFEQAIDMGAVDRGQIKKIWKSASDRRVRHSHAIMHDQERDMDAPFVSPNGAQMQFPGDWSLDAPADEIINCRCIVEYDVDWITGQVD